MKKLSPTNTLETLDIYDGKKLVSEYDKNGFIVRVFEENLTAKEKKEYNLRTKRRVLNHMNGRM